MANKNILWDLYNKRITRKRLEGKSLNQAINETNSELMSIIGEQSGRMPVPQTEQQQDTQTLQQEQNTTQQENNPNIDTAVSDVEKIMQKMQRYTPEGGYVSKIDVKYNPQELNNYIKTVASVLGSTQEKEQPYEGMIMQSPFGFNYRYNAPSSFFNEILKTYSNIKENEQREKQAGDILKTIEKQTGGAAGTESVSVGYGYKPEYAYSGGTGSYKGKDYFLEYNKNLDAARQTDITGEQYYGNLLTNVLSPYEAKALNEGDYGSIIPIIEEKYRILSVPIELARGSDYFLQQQNITDYFDKVVKYSKDAAEVLYRYYKIQGMKPEEAKMLALNKINKELKKVYEGLLYAKPSEAYNLLPKDWEIKDFDTTKVDKDSIVAKAAYNKAKDSGIWASVDEELYKAYQEKTNKKSKNPPENINIDEIISKLGEQRYADIITKSINEKFSDILNINNQMIKDSVIDIINEEAKEKYKIEFVK